MTTFITSDWHFNHNLISTLRGFDSPEAHDEFIIKKINEIVKPDDTLFCLGDVTFNANNMGLEYNLNIVDRINGNKHLITGNHDRCAANNSNSWKYRDLFTKHFESVSEFTRINVNGTGVMLSHYPYTNDSLGNLKKFALPDYGMPIVHGHTHSDKLITFSDNNTIQINANLESTDLMPLSLEQIQKLIERKM